MSAFAEFCLIAVALYLWESTLWLPLRSVALRRRWFTNRWQVLNPDQWLSLKETGLVPLLPLLSDAGLAPCQAPPLLAADNGELLMTTSDGRLVPLAAVGWTDLREEQHHLAVGGLKTRLSSARCVAVLRRAKLRGATPAAAVRQAWRFALSPVRARREWRRWRLVAGPLGWLPPALTFGFFVGLPLVYLFRGSLPAVLFALWLWCLMAMIAAHLWWLGRRVYPGARAALRMDAVLALLVPFHAMRAREIAAVHALGTTHPAGLLLSTADLTNPWLAGFVRGLRHPRPEVPEDFIRSAALLPPLELALAHCGRTVADFDCPPDHARDPAAVAYCPRCHGMFLGQVEVCPDCRGLALRPFC